MFDPGDLSQFKAFMLSIGWAQARILGMFIVIPIFSRSLLPGILRLCVAAALGLIVAPTLMPIVAVVDLDAGRMLLLLVKEAFVGLVMGCLIAVPFWAFEALGFLMDNQRGATMGATLDPLTGNDSSPLGTFFSQAFIVFFFISGGFVLVLEVLYESFILWNVFEWTPHLRRESMPLFIEQILRLVRLALLLSAPVIVAMFMAEMGLAFVSRFVPQLQVFFLAMPIKSALMLLVLVLYMTTLFEYAHGLLDGIRSVIPVLDGAWQKSQQGMR